MTLDLDKFFTEYMAQQDRDKSCPDKMDEIFLSPEIFGGGNDLQRQGIYYITGEIDDNSLLGVHQDILGKHLDPAWVDDIQVIVNSPGGYCKEAWPLIDLWDWVKFDVRTVGIGECASMGSILVAGGTKGKRSVAARAHMMIHGPSGGTFGTIQQMEAQRRAIENENRIHLEFWLENSKLKTEDQVKKKLLNGEDHWLTAEEALKLGIVDEIAGKAKPEKKKRGRKKKTDKTLSPQEALTLVEEENV